MNISKAKEKINLRKQSFEYAFAGFKSMWQLEINFRIHTIISMVVVCLGFILKINNVEWIAVVLCSASVLSAEIINTAIEQLCDIISKEKRSEIKLIKDISAASVLILAVGSIIIGSIIFIPKVI